MSLAQYAKLMIIFLISPKNQNLKHTHPTQNHHPKSPPNITTQRLAISEFELEHSEYSEFSECSEHSNTPTNSNHKKIRVKFVVICG